MIVLDTNVLAELMRPAPSEAVLAWYARQPLAELFTTAITESEILTGLALLPRGRRRAALEAAAQGVFDELGDQLLPFDSNAARAFAEIEVDCRRAGRPITRADAEIAAISRSLGAALATRNLDDFTHCGVVLVDPWSA
ncbi:MAG: type II toxin-antitoxin system VapC family toxin [Myxococcaceae bacterium]|nr:type II toxin-antitoxin system VapC family toxin [Myxococcaceae bacterium]